MSMNRQARLAFSAIILAVVMILTLMLSVSFCASEVYYRGDADGDGSVETIDATLIQRVLCEMVEDTDGLITLRGDVDGTGELEVTDVTFIQRWLADMTVVYEIGVPVEPATEAPTQAPTQASTQAPTQAPTRDYELPVV